MLQQEISELEFDRYLSVSTNPVHNQEHHRSQYLHQQQHREHQQQMLYSQPQPVIQRSIEPTEPLSISRSIPPPVNCMSSQLQQNPKPSIEVIDWCLKQQPQDLHTVLSTATTGQPAIQKFHTSYHYAYPNNRQTTDAPPSHDGYSSITSSPALDLAQQNLTYTHRHSFANNGNMGYSNASKRAGDNMNPNAGLVSATNIPTPVSDMLPSTPLSQSSYQSNDTCKSASDHDRGDNTMNASAPLKNAFAAIDQWRKANQDTLLAATWKAPSRRESNLSNASEMVAATVAAVKARFSPEASVNPSRQFQKVAHNAIERRYRNNINDRIRDLKNVVPALCKANIKEKRKNSNGSEDDEDSSDDEDRDEIGEIIDGVEVARKLNKATILLKAVEYIQHLKHTNDLAERENQVLQQLLSQLPGGNEVLARFQAQKREFQQAEYQRLIAERKEALEQEKIERQRMLRERAAQRAALAELIPKPERKPYRRRAKKQQEKQQKPKKHAPSKRPAYNTASGFDNDNVFTSHDSFANNQNTSILITDDTASFRNHTLPSSNQSQLIH